MPDTEFDPDAYDTRHRRLMRDHSNTPARRVELAKALDAEFRAALEADRCPTEFPAELREAIYRKAWDSRDLHYDTVANNYTNLVEIASLAFRLSLTRSP